MLKWWRDYKIAVATREKQYEMDHMTDTDLMFSYEECIGWIALRSDGVPGDILIEIGKRKQKYLDRWVLPQIKKRELL